VRLLLDENVSPSIVGLLNDAGHDAYHVRDRGLRGEKDHVIWRRAVAENRVLVTINARDFVRLARREELHGGLMTFPSGSRPAEQLILILRAIERFEADRMHGEDSMNRWVDIRDDGEIKVTDLASRSR
jgi:predicted nuclease of predicted toxin-antitoxin system